MNNDICFNNEQIKKTESTISVTEEGIYILVNDEHPKKEEFPIEVIEGGIAIFVNNDQFMKLHELPPHIVVKIN